VCVYLCFLIFGLNRMGNRVVLIPLHVVQVLEAFLIGLETKNSIEVLNSNWDLKLVTRYLAYIWYERSTTQIDRPRINNSTCDYILEKFH
jgi:hypothetical protein